MSKVQLAGNVSGTGIFTIASPNSNVDRTLTLPDNTGTLLSSASTVAAGQLPTQFSVNSGAPAGSFAMDASGRITLPNQPAFRAGFATSGDASTTSGAAVPFDAETFDAGGNYNTSNYRFTAPVAGRYLFHANVYFSQSAGAFTGGIGFLLNGVQVLTTASDGARSDGNFGNSGGQMTILSLNNTMLLNLSAGDYVQVFGINYSGSPFRYYKGTSFWQGTLIS